MYSDAYALISNGMAASVCLLRACHPSGGPGSPSATTTHRLSDQWVQKEFLLASRWAVAATFLESGEASGVSGVGQRENLRARGNYPPPSFWVFSLSLLSQRADAEQSGKPLGRFHAEGQRRHI